MIDDDWSLDPALWSRKAAMTLRETPRPPAEDRYIHYAHWDAALTERLLRPHRNQKGSIVEKNFVAGDRVKVSYSTEIRGVQPLLLLVRAPGGKGLVEVPRSAVIKGLPTPEEEPVLAHWVNPGLGEDFEFVKIARNSWVRLGADFAPVLLTMTDHAMKSGRPKDKERPLEIGDKVQVEYESRVAGGNLGVALTVGVVHPFNPKVRTPVPTEFVTKLGPSAEQAVVGAIWRERGVRYVKITRDRWIRLGVGTGYDNEYIDQFCRPEAE